MCYSFLFGGVWVQSSRWIAFASQSCLTLLLHGLLVCICICVCIFLHFYSLAALWLCLARASWFAEGPTLCWLYPTLYWSQTIMQLAAKMTMKSSGGDNNDGDHGSVDSREGYWSWTMPSTGNTVAPWNKRQTLPFGQHSLFQHQPGGFLWISFVDFSLTDDLPAFWIKPHTHLFNRWNMTPAGKAPFVEDLFTDSLFCVSSHVTELSHWDF